MKKLYFASDNWAPAHPQILKAIHDANEGYAPAYGGDAWTEKAQKVIQDAFKSNCKVFIVPTGTGSNIFALKLACRAHESVICTDSAHINYQETGASEAIIGCKLLSVPHQEGKLRPEAVLKKLKSERSFGKHSTSPRVVSIAQTTEVGTVYNLEELQSLSKLCKEEGLLFHIDGSRFYNALMHMQIEPHQFIEQVPIDILSLGGTKNGMLGAEALLIFNPEMHAASEYLQKQTLQLSSKMRYLSAQYLPFFHDKLWKNLAANANLRAQEIASVIRSIPHLTLSYPVDSNQVFFTLPEQWIPLLQEQVFCIPWDKEKNEVRLIASWNTSEQDIKEFQKILMAIAKTT